MGLKRVLSCPSRFDILYQDRNDFQPNCGIAELAAGDSRVLSPAREKNSDSFPLARLSSELTRQDAFKRIERLEELRAKIREERQRTVMGAHASVPWLGTMVLCNQRWGTSPGTFGLAKKISWHYICAIYESILCLRILERSLRLNFLQIFPDLPLWEWPMGSR